jgi:hypothetical protein
VIAKKLPPDDSRKLPPGILLNDSKSQPPIIQATPRLVFGLVVDSLCRIGNWDGAVRRVDGFPSVLGSPCLIEERGSGHLGAFAFAEEEKKRPEQGELSQGQRRRQYPLWHLSIARLAL